MSTKEYWEKLILTQKQFIDMVAIECTIQDYVRGRISRDILPVSLSVSLSGLKFFNLPAAAIDAASKLASLISTLSPNTKEILNRITDEVNRQSLQMNKAINDLSGSFDLFEIEYPFIEYSNGVRIIQGKGTITRAHHRNGSGWTSNV